jgi:hypothetical protein
VGPFAPAEDREREESDAAGSRGAARVRPGVHCGACRTLRQTEEVRGTMGPAVEAVALYVMATIVGPVGLCGGPRG